MSLFVLAGGTLPAGEAAAQVKPAYTKNVDERGRVPYNVNVEFSVAAGCSFNCAAFFKFNDFPGPVTMVFDAVPAVPAGKRLIVEWVSAALPANSNVNSISFQTSPVIANQNAKWQYHGPFFSSAGGIVSGMSSGAFFTVEPGESPHIRVAVADSSHAVFSVTIGGYLIDATN